LQFTWHSRPLWAKQNHPLELNRISRARASTLVSI